MRREKPGSYSAYRSYKPYLRNEFGGQCVYCRMPDTMRGAEQFGVDHYRPKSHFPHLATTYTNLYYCCNACNSRKGNYWPTLTERRAGRLVPNPCDHVMFAHLRYRASRVESKSSTGAFALDLLDLNDQSTVTYRASMLTALDSLAYHRAQIAAKKRKVRAALDEGKITEEKAEAYMMALDEQDATLDASLNYLCGG